MYLKLYSIKEVFPLLRISEVSLRRLIKSNKITYRRIGKRILIDEEDILHFLSSSAVPMIKEKHENNILMEK